MVHNILIMDQIPAELSIKLITELLFFKSFHITLV